MLDTPHSKTPSLDRRKHVRLRSEYVVSLSGNGIRVPGVALDLSVSGCRIRSQVAVNKGDSFGMLIDVPRYEYPLLVTLAVARWSHGEEFGMEFIKMAPDDQERLRELIRVIEAGRAIRQDTEIQ